MGQKILGKKQKCISNSVHKMAAASSGSQLAQKAFHSVCIPGTPPKTGISGTYFKWKVTSTTASKGCPFFWNALEVFD